MNQKFLESRNYCNWAFNKRIYLTETEAWDSISIVEESDNYVARPGYHLSVYKCKYGNHYHIGHSQ